MGETRRRVGDSEYSSQWGSGVKRGFLLRFKERTACLYDERVERIKLMMQEKEGTISGALFLIRKGGGDTVSKWRDRP